MSNLQIKGIDDGLYRELKQLASDENRSVSQQVLYLIRTSLAQRKQRQRMDTSAQSLLSLAGSWENSREAEEIVREIRKARRSSHKLSEGL
jgi:hypothetical protein